MTSYSAESPHFVKAESNLLETGIYEKEFSSWPQNLVPYNEAYMVIIQIIYHEFHLFLWYIFSNFTSVRAMPKWTMTQHVDVIGSKNVSMPGFSCQVLCVIGYMEVHYNTFVLDIGWLTCTHQVIWILKRASNQESYHTLFFFIVIIFLVRTIASFKTTSLVSLPSMLQHYLNVFSLIN